MITTKMLKFHSIRSFHKTYKYFVANCILCVSIDLEDITIALLHGVTNAI